VGPASPTVAVDLTEPREERLRKASAHHRRALRKALANGLAFEPDSGDRAIAEFTACYRETMAKHQAGRTYELTEERVAELLTGLGDHAELWLARKPDGSAASAALFLRTDGILQYHLGGTRNADYALGAARPLFEAVADSGHERGDRWLHLGGGVGGDDDSLLRYKAGFGPDRFVFRTIRAVFDPAAYDAGVRASGLDPDRGFFPAYRESGLGV
jgi:lipid II:glycine glycyltransferase (peptidoglycan interpeptide bridge formation enzyme)